VTASVLGRIRPSAPVIEPTASYDAPPEPDPLAPDPNARRVVRWCEVEAVLASRCQRCHAIPSQAGAPFPLLGFADTQREHPPGSGEPIVRRMAHVIRHRIMPPIHMPLEPPVLPLEPAEVDLLLVWLEEGGLPFGGVDCASQRAPGAPASASHR